MGSGAGLLDTSVVILLPELDDPESLPSEPYISAITLAEMSVGPLVAASEEKRAARQAQVQKAEEDFDPLPFNAASARAFARVATSVRRAGRKVQARTFDTLIAATAIANGLPLYTCNPDDFAGIDELELFAVPHPDQQEESDA